MPPSDNGSEDTSVDAAIPGGAGPGRGACSFMHWFLLHHMIFDHRLVDGLWPDQPRLQGHLLCRKDWSGQSYPSKKLPLTLGARSANTSALENCPEARRAKWADVGWAPCMVAAR